MDVGQAELVIAGILERLEKASGSVIESLGIEDIEITAIGDDRRQLQRRVVIELARLPGSNWPRTKVPDNC